MAQGLAWVARESGVPARVIVPAEAPRAKLDKIEALGAEIVPVTHEEWWQAMVDRGREGIGGLFVAPAAEEAVMAGNGTIGLEIAEDAPEFDTVIVPWGGGGLTTGIASALKALRPEVRVVTAEPETGAPLAAAFAAGEPREIEFTPSWVDGAGGRALLPGMWERAGARRRGGRRTASEVEEARAAPRLARPCRGRGSRRARARGRAPPGRPLHLHRQRREHRVSEVSRDPRVRQQRHRKAGIAAEQHGARDRGAAVTVADRVHRGVERLPGPEQELARRVGLAALRQSSRSA